VLNLITAPTPLKIVYDGKTFLKSLFEAISDFTITSGAITQILKMFLIQHLNTKNIV
jgi:hypothetical protein